MVRGLGADGLFVEEKHHRTEHSIEFQAVMIRHLVSDEGVRILPVLCGSMHRHIADGSNPRDVEEAERFLSALETAVQGRRVCWVAGADLAHVGPRFGDTRPFDTSDREELREADDELLDRVTAGDADGFFAAVARAGDRHRVCGTSAIYAMLRMVNGASGRVVAYDQCPATEDGGSLVSIASAIFDG
jgi:AmmeMemoRadiSam system protein B